MGVPGGHERELWDHRGPRDGLLRPQGLVKGSLGSSWGSLGVLGGPWGGFRGHLGVPRGPKEGHEEPLGVPFGVVFGLLRQRRIIEKRCVLLLFRNMEGPRGHERELWDLRGPRDGLLWSQGSPEGSLGGPFRVFGGSLGALWGSLGSLPGSLGGPWGTLGVPRRVLGSLWGHFWSPFWISGATQNH